MKEKIDESELMVLQGYTRAFFRWILKKNNSTEIQKTFIELRQEFNETPSVGDKFLPLMIVMALKDELISHDDVEKLKTSLMLAGEMDTYGWLITSLKKRIA